jgi:UDP-glucuronate 4-epimerase
MSNILNFNPEQTVLVTGGAGFIGSNLVDKLLALGNKVVSFDSFNDFYDPKAKARNVQEHLKHPNFTLVRGDLRDEHALARAFAHGPFDVVVHLAAMAGVLPSLADPTLYMDINVTGAQKLLNQIAASSKTTRLIFGSSSSVYGARSGECFRETDAIDQPLSPYAASKVAGEAICYAYHHTTKMPVVCLRFFTVFGPRQRPDLAIRKFANLIDQGKSIDVYGDGTSKRDYTFVGDIVSGIISSMSYESPGFDVINLGRSEPVILKEMIATIEKAMGKKAKLVQKPVQMADMPYTYAAIDKARQVLGYKPETSFEAGVEQFVAWFLKNKEEIQSEIPLTSALEVIH